VPRNQLSLGGQLAPLHHRGGGREGVKEGRDTFRKCSSKFRLAVSMRNGRGQPHEGVVDTERVTPSPGGGVLGCPAILACGTGLLSLHSTHSHGGDSKARARILSVGLLHEVFQAAHPVEVIALEGMFTALH
jgi:hypothetical protein